MDTNLIRARLFGISFLIGYLSYGIGFGILNVKINAPSALSSFQASKNSILIYGAIMMSIFACINIVLPILVMPIFKKFNQTLSYGYFGFAITATLLLIIGGIFLIILIPLSNEYLTSNAIDKSYFNTIAVLLKKANFYAYQIGMAVWGFAGLMFCYLLNISNIAPKWLSIYGFISYIIFISGAVFAIFGVNIDILLDIPGGLFEIYLSIYFIIKGFKSNTSNLIL